MLDLECVSNFNTRRTFVVMVIPLQEGETT